MTTATSYSSRHVADLAGITYRQLDHWTRLGLVRPSIDAVTGSGHHRRWSSHDVAVLRVLATVAGRVPLNRLGALVGFLDDLPLQQWAATSILLDLDGDVWLPNDNAPKVAIHIDLSLIFDPPEAA